MIKAKRLIDELSEKSSNILEELLAIESKALTRDKLFSPAQEKAKELAQNINQLSKKEKNDFYYNYPHFNLEKNFTLTQAYNYIATEVGFTSWEQFKSQVIVSLRQLEDKYKIYIKNLDFFKAKTLEELTQDNFNKVSKYIPKGKELDVRLIKKIAKDKNIKLSNDLMIENMHNAARETLANTTFAYMNFEYSFAQTKSPLQGNLKWLFIHHCLFHKCMFKNNDFSFAQCSHVDFVECFFPEHCDFYAARMYECLFEGAMLTESYMRMAELVNSNFIKANLSFSNMFMADLTGSNLKDANLTHVDLRGAILVNADFDGADLKYAKLAGANLKGARLIGARNLQLDGAIIDETTLL